MILHEAGSGLPGTGGGCQVGRAFARQRLGSVAPGNLELDPSAAVSLTRRGRRSRTTVSASAPVAPASARGEVRGWRGVHSRQRSRRRGFLEGSAVGRPAAVGTALGLGEARPSADVNGRGHAEAGRRSGGLARARPSASPSTRWAPRRPGRLGEHGGAGVGSEGSAVGAAVACSRASRRLRRRRSGHRARPRSSVICPCAVARCSVVSSRRSEGSRCRGTR